MDLAESSELILPYLLDSLQFLIYGFYLSLFVFLGHFLSKLFSVYHAQLTTLEETTSKEDRAFKWWRIERFLDNFFETAEMVQLYNTMFRYCIGFNVVCESLCAIFVFQATTSYGYEGGYLNMAKLIYQAAVCFLLLYFPAKANEEANKSYPTSCKICRHDLAANQQIKLLALQNYMTNSPVGFYFFNIRMVNDNLITSYLGLYIVLLLYSNNRSDNVDKENGGLGILDDILDNV